MKKLVFLLIVVVAGLGLFSACATGGSDDEAKAAQVDMDKVDQTIDELQYDLDIVDTAIRLALPTLMEGDSYDASGLDGSDAEYAEHGAPAEFSDHATGGGLCPSRDWDLDRENHSLVVTITYAEGCERFGTPVEGEIVVNLAKQGDYVPVSLAFNDLQIGSTNVDGELDAMFGNGLLFDGDLAIVRDGVKSRSLTFSSCHFVWDAELDVVELSGAIQYVDAGGDEYSVVIAGDDPVSFIADCPFPVDGMITVSFVFIVPVDVWVDFGAPEPGVCDSDVDWDIVW